jgi:hypothetical protein
MAVNMQENLERKISSKKDNGINNTLSKDSSQELLDVGGDEEN